MSKILILGTSRGGTTYLRQLLQSALNVKYDSPSVMTEEIGRRWRTVDFYTQEIMDYTLDSIKNIFDTTPGDALSKDHIQHYNLYKEITGKQFPVNYVYPNFFKIKLVRNDVRAVSLSLVISKTLNNFYNIANDLRITIDVNEYKECLKTTISDIISLIEFESDFDLYLSYDDLSFEPEKDLALITDPNLTCDTIPSVTVKKRPSYETTIDNLEELMIAYQSVIDEYNNGYNVYVIEDDKILLRNNL